MYLKHGDISLYEQVEEMSKTFKEEVTFEIVSTALVQTMVVWIA